MTPRRYGLTVAEMVTRLQDSHGAIGSQAFTAYMGTHRPPLRLDPVEGQFVVTAVDESAKGSVDVQVGDIVLAVDNEDLAARRERLAKYLPASTRDALHLAQAKEVLKGAKDSEAVLKVRTRRGEVKDVRMIRTVPAASRAASLQKLPVYTVGPEGFGYVDIDRLSGAEADTAYAAVRNTPGLIVDLRGYIGGGSREFIGSMVKKANQPALMISRLAFDGMDGDFMKNTDLQATYTHPGAAPYQGKVVVLIGTGTVSAAESACMTLATIGVDVTFIGAPTMGANGNVTNASLPGGVAVQFTGMEIRHPDGRQLQRLGIQPDIEVRPTIQGIALGRDEVLERAVAFLKTGRK